MCTKFHSSLIKNNKVIDVWNFFFKSAFRLVGLVGKIMDLHQQDFSGQYWGVQLTCIPNFSQIGQFLQKLSHFIEFRLVGWLGRLASSDFKKFLAAKRINMTSVYTKNQADISRHSKVIHFLGFFWKISIRRLFGWLGQLTWYDLI